MATLGSRAARMSSLLVGSSSCRLVPVGSSARRCQLQERPVHRALGDPPPPHRFGFFWTTNLKFESAFGAPVAIVAVAARLLYRAISYGGPRGGCGERLERGGGLGGEEAEGHAAGRSRQRAR